MINQIPQIDDRWTIEIEKQSRAYEARIQSIEATLEETKNRFTKEFQSFESKIVSLREKEKLLEDTTLKLTYANSELAEKQKIIAVSLELFLK